MQERTDYERKDEGQVRCMTGKMQDWRDAGQEDAGVEG